MTRWPLLRSFLTVASLAAGSLLYILFRPESLLMFRWAESLGLSSSIDSLRTGAHSLELHLPMWTVYSLPYALWVLAYMLAIDIIWGDTQPFARHVWFWSIPVAAISSEFAQSLHWIPGRFDLTDVTSIVIASVLGFGLSSQSIQSEGIATT